MIFVVWWLRVLLYLLRVCVKWGIFFGLCFLICMTDKGKYTSSSRPFRLRTNLFIYSFFTLKLKFPGKWTKPVLFEVRSTYFRSLSKDLNGIEGAKISCLELLTPYSFTSRLIFLDSRFLRKRFLPWETSLWWRIVNNCR